MKFECPNCGQHYDLGNDYAGQTVECQKCGKSFTIAEQGSVKDFVAAIHKRCDERTAQTANISPAMDTNSSFGSVSGTVSLLLVIAAVSVAGMGIAGFNDSSAQSAIHQIFFALRTLAYLAGSIIILLIAILVKMK